MERFCRLNHEMKPMVTASAAQTVFLSRRLTMALVFVMSLVLVLAAGVFYVFTVFELEKNFNAKMNHTMDMFSGLLIPTLSPLDVHIVRKVSQAALRYEFVSGVVVRDHEGNTVFAENIQNGRVHTTSGNPRKSRVVRVNGEIAGELELYFYPVSTADNLKRIMWLSLFFWLVSILTIILLTKVFVRRYFRGPLASLTDLAHYYRLHPGVYPSPMTPYFEFQPIEKVLRTQADDVSRHFQELVKSRERFAIAMKSADGGLFDFNLQTNDIYYSPGWKKMLGYKDYEIKNELSAWERLAEPRLFKSTEALIHELRQGKRKHFKREFRLKHKKGHWVDILSRGRVVYDKNGRPIRVVGTHIDISEQKKSDERLKTALKEKHTLVQELYHRTKNNMLVILSMLSLQSAYIKDESLLKVFSETENRIHTMALAHKRLYRSKNLSEISLQEYVSDLCELLVGRYNETADRSVAVIYDIDDVNVVMDSAVPCGMVLNELISNSLQYAFPDNRKGEISISIRKTDQKEIILRFADNGVGVPEGFDFGNTPTLGMRLIFTVVSHQLKGNIAFRNDDGLTCEIKYKDMIYGARV